MTIKTGYGNNCTWKTSQIWLKGFNALIRGFFWCIDREVHRTRNGNTCFMFTHPRTWCTRSCDLLTLREDGRFICTEETDFCFNTNQRENFNNHSWQQDQKADLFLRFFPIHWEQLQIAIVPCWSFGNKKQNKKKPHGYVASVECAVWCWVWMMSRVSLFTLLCQSAVRFHWLGLGALEI